MKWVLIIVLIHGPDDGLHARGPFSSRDNCVKYIDYLLANPRMPSWWGRCISTDDLRERYSHAQFDVES